jgi:DNA-binding NarL/FixJ family response regulator
MTKPIRVMMVEDHVLVRQALRNMLEADGSVQVVAECSSWQDALRRQEELGAEFVLMDIALQGGSGINGIEQMRERWSDLPILAISGHLDAETVLGALQAGASGYIAKSASRDELLTAFRVVQQGGSYLDPQLTRMVLSQLRTRPSGGSESRQTLSLTPRERQIMELVAEGMANRDIAERLFLTETTVKSYLRTLYRRLSVSDRAQAVAYVIRAGLISVPHDPSH